MTAGVLHDRIPPDPSKDEIDTLVQVEAVSRALTELGHSPVPVEFHHDIDTAMETLERRGPDFVFNLAESLSGRGRFICLAPLVLEQLGVPFTGCPARAVLLTSDKVLAKRVMSLAGVPTPPWVSLDGFGATGSGAPGSGAPGFGAETLSGRFIFKSVWEHASIGLDEGAVAEVGSAEELRGLLVKRSGVSTGGVFAERYVEGREFNISLLGGGRPEILAPAEMTFGGFPEGAPRILGYRAKWDEGSPEYASTVRSFEFGEGDQPLLRRLGALSLRCWDLFGLRGYARVDFRVDGGGEPFVLEINANPCIAPDSGFVAAAARSGLGFRDVVRRIVDCAAGNPLRRGARP